MTKISSKIKPQKWMQSEFLKQVISALGEARLVGGCVRDSLLGRKIKDVDIATPNQPEKVMALLKKKGIKVIPTGLKHGTITAVRDKELFEITTLRKDIDCDGRHATVEYTSDWQEDAARRDFTINAMFMDLSGEVYDYFGGIDDLKKGIIRFVGDPYARVQEDYLRILRYFRFEVNYGSHAIDKESLSACIKYREKIDNLSGERIQIEMLKLLSAKDPHRVLNIMKEEGILACVIPGSDEKLDLDAIKHLVNIEKEEGSLIPSEDSIIRLALLIQKGKKQVIELCERWKLSNVHKKQLLDLIEPLMEINSRTNEKDYKRYLTKLGKEDFIKQLLFLWAKDERNDHIMQCKSMLAMANTWKIPVFPIGGKDILALGVKPGERVGDLLERAYIIWEKSDYALTKKQLMEIIKKDLD